MKYPNRIIKEGEANTAIVKAIQKKLMELHIGDLQGTGVYAAKTKNVMYWTYLQYARENDKRF